MKLRVIIILEMGNKLGFGVFLLAISTVAHAATVRDQAYRMYQRIAGVPPTATELSQMEQLGAQGKWREAAQVATRSYGFYNSNLIRFAKPFSNRSETTRPETGESGRLPLNDLVATLVGMVRDDVPFDQVLYSDILYKGVNGLANVAAYANDSNTHYQNLGDRLDPAGLDLRSAQVLERTTQTAVRATIPDVAGVMTTRQYGVAHFSAGTNRRPLQYVLRQFLCEDLSQLADASIPDVRVRRDVDRQPAGDAKVYLTTCKGCHSGMDALAGGLARFEFNNNQLVYSATAIQGKITKNGNVFPGGYNTGDDSWVNLWAEGNNQRLGWRGGVSNGRGVNSLGKLLAKTRAFSTCSVKNVYQFVCLKKLESKDQSLVDRLADEFEKDGKYSLRSLFEAVAAEPSCMALKGGE